MPTTKSALPFALSLLLGLATTVALRAEEPAAPAAPPPAAPSTPAAPADSAPAPQTPAAAAATPTDTSDLAKQLATAESNLATSLRSYTLLQNETDQFKANAAHELAAVQAAADKAVFEAQSAAAKTTLEATSQAAALRDELRQTQAQVAALATENADLKTRLALSGPPPGTTLVTPTRPGAAADMLKPQAVTPTPEPVPAPVMRTYKVAFGDSLTKISRHFYGTADRWKDIFEANRDVIKNENNLPAGETIKIP